MIAKPSLLFRFSLILILLLCFLLLQGPPKPLDLLEFPLNCNKYEVEHDLIHFPLIKQSVLLATHLPKVTKMEIKGGKLLHNSNSNLKIIEEIAKYLPDLVLLVNELDEPRVLKNNPNRMGGDANHWGMDFDPEHNIY